MFSMVPADVDPTGKEKRPEPRKGTLPSAIYVGARENLSLTSPLTHLPVFPPRCWNKLEGRRTPFFLLQDSGLDLKQVQVGEARNFSLK